jgi:hypothetical protein
MGTAVSETQGTPEGPVLRCVFYAPGKEQVRQVCSAPRSALQVGCAPRVSALVLSVTFLSSDDCTVSHSRQHRPLEVQPVSPASPAAAGRSRAGPQQLCRTGVTASPSHLQPSLCPVSCPPWATEAHSSKARKSVELSTGSHQSSCPAEFLRSSETEGNGVWLCVVCGCVCVCIYVCVYVCFSVSVCMVTCMYVCCLLLCVSIPVCVVCA